MLRKGIAMCREAGVHISGSICPTVRINRRHSSFGRCGWRTFKDMLRYKCDTLIQVDRFFASSQTCRQCGFKNAKVKNLTVRQWICPQCGAVHDRDKNASKNILREGLSRYSLSSSSEGFE